MSEIIFRAFGPFFGTVLANLIEGINDDEQCAMVVV